MELTAGGCVLTAHPFACPCVVPFLLKGDLDGTTQRPHENCSLHCALHNAWVCVSASYFKAAERQRRESEWEKEGEGENESNCWQKEYMDDYIQINHFLTDSTGKIKKILRFEVNNVYNSRFVTHCDSKQVIKYVTPLLISPLITANMLLSLIFVWFRREMQVEIPAPYEWVGTSLHTTKSYPHSFPNTLFGSSPLDIHGPSVYHRDVVHLQVNRPRKRPWQALSGAPLCPQYPHFTERRTVGGKWASLNC